MISPEDHDQARLAALEAIAQLVIEKGLLSTDEITAAADEIETDGSALATETAHNLRCMVIEAAAPSQSDFEASSRRAQMHVVTDSD